MKFSKVPKRILVTISIIFAFLVILFVALNLIIGNIIESKISKALAGKDEIRYQVTFDNVSVNVITGNVKIKGFKVIPDSAFFEKYKSGETVLAGMMRIEVPKFSLLGLNLFQTIRTSEIALEDIEFKGADFKYYTGANFIKIDTIPETDKKKSGKRLNLDSVQLTGLKGLAIERINFVRCNIAVFNVIKEDTVISASDIDLSLAGLQLAKLEGDGDYFRFGLDKLRFELTDEKIGLPGNMYILSFSKLILDKTNLSVVIKNLKMYPKMEDKFKMAKKLIYTTEIYDLSIKELTVNQFDVRRLINEGKVYIGSIDIDSLDIDMLKDKRMPWNYNKRPQFPNHQLRLMKFPLYIGQVNLRNSRLTYHEKMEGVDEHMRVTLDNLNAQINNVTSIKDSTANGKPMTIDVSSKLMSVAELKAIIIMPLNSKADTFSFSGSLGQAKLESFNSALQPAMGMQITSGNLEKMTFAAQANNNYSTGEMVMIYDDLTATLLKNNDEEDQKKFLSWIANTVVQKSNPGKKGQLRVAKMGFEKVEYKGFGNFLWKTLQTGIVNSILPTGKTTKVSTKSNENTNQESTKKSRKEKNKTN